MCIRDSLNIITTMDNSNMSPSKRDMRTSNDSNAKTIRTLSGIPRTNTTVKPTEKLKYTAADLSAFRYFELQVQDFVKELSARTTKIQSCLEQPAEPSEGNIMEDYSKEFAVRQEATDFVRAVKGNTLQSEEERDREKAWESLEEMRTKLAGMEERQKKEKELILFFAKVLSHVKGRFESIERKSKEVQTTFRRTAIADNIKFQTAEANHSYSFPLTIESGCNS
eukprot:TRINITY_DN14250_c0_g1_i4.p2 TRINITY_DN14250_c0_g1~~TRINITY_DN14250_c0_g1_i4.p2  ORF type:complete len:224 (+),score=71.85 TRINITY_DN14250_c0_g1_i4:73-744(+)